MKTRSQRQTRSTQAQSGRPGAGKGRREEVKGSGIYPASGPLPPGRAKVITPAAMGQRERSAAAGASRGATVQQKKSRGQTTAALARTLPKRASVHRKVAAAGAETPRDIPRKDWKEFLDDFSVEHDGWTTEIRAFQPDQTPRMEVRDLPLEGVSIDLARGRAMTFVSAGEHRSDHLTQSIPQTTRITALNENELEIQAADKSRTIVRCWEPKG